MPSDSSPSFRAFRSAFASLALSGVALTWAGCSSPRQDYLAAHSQMSADHRRIMQAGKLIDRDPVAGMTKEEIRLTMGGDPTQATSINGEEVWIWVKKKLEPLSMMEGTDRSSGGTGSGSFANIPRESDQTPGQKGNIRTTVFFQGNQATKVDVTEESMTGQF